ncbi:ribonuclease P [Variovorax sp. PBS-H4]|uniref:ribonuclease P protein component n=1 Tax=Variovorax sp. PBS-H4 TaxID=434008 RepID=UPI0013186ABF|nr:ribonuclease P protein component [Variovorax sp. PBS-H4]VTU41367.1 ribonuclease P [Variovorax sp. PBS-H4]
MQRLKTRAQFQAVLAGATVARTTHFALHRCALDAHSGSSSLFATEDVWVGAMVPKRWARRAVTRNAIKRQIYRMSTAMRSSLPPAAHLVRLRAGFDRKEFHSAKSEKLNAAVRAELQQLLERAAAVRAP